MKALTKTMLLFSVIICGTDYGLTYKVSNDSDVNRGGFFLSRWDPSGAKAYSTCAASQADLKLSDSFTSLNVYNVTYISDSGICSNIQSGDIVPSGSANPYLLVNLFGVSYQYAPGNLTGVLTVNVASISSDVTFNPNLQVLCDGDIDLFAKYTNGYQGTIYPKDDGVCKIHITSN